MLFLEIQRTENFHDFALDGTFLVARNILYCLLGQGRSAEGAVESDKQVHHCLAGAQPVYAVVLLKALVFNGNRRIRQIFGHGLVIGPDTIGAAMQRLQFLPLACFVFIKYHRALGHGDLRNIHMGIGDNTRCQIHAEDGGKNHTGAQHNQNQRFDDPSYGRPALSSGRPALLRLCILTVPARFRMLGMTLLLHAENLLFIVFILFFSCWRQPKSRQ